MTPTANTELGKFERLAGNAMLHRRVLLEGAGVFAGALGMGVRLKRDRRRCLIPRCKGRGKKDRLRSYRPR